MFSILPVNRKGILAFKVSGKLTDEDYRQFLPVLESMIREFGVISLFIELEDFQGWEGSAAWEDFRFGLQHDKDFKRIAIVGDSAIEHWVVSLANFFTRTEMRFFDRSQAQEAWDWLEEKPEEEDRMRPPEPYRNILLATDFSAYSERAAQRARELCAQYGASLQVLHVVEPVVFYSDGYDPVLADIPLADDALMVKAEDSLRRFAERMQLGKEVPLDVQWGAPKWTIVSWAREKGIDLIVVGSHGRRGIERILGSVSSGVLSQAHCDVLVVKP